MQISILPSAGLVPPTSLSVSSVQLPAGVEASAQMHTLMVQTVSMFVLSQSTLQYALAIIIISVELENTGTTNTLLTLTDNSSIII